MPTYEYECSSCRHAWDLFQSIKADPERKCPKCGRMTARRKIGIGAAILSGGRSADAQEAPAAGTTGTTPATVGTQAA
jgi:putative FmdB family regulatory protein